MLPLEDNTVFRSQSDKNAPQKSFRLKPPYTRHAVSYYHFTYEKIKLQ